MFELLTGMGIGWLTMRLAMHLRTLGKPRWVDVRLPKGGTGTEPGPKTEAPQVAVAVAIPGQHLFTIGFRYGFLCSCGAVAPLKWRDADHFESLCPTCGPKELVDLSKQVRQRQPGPAR